ncbi:hypothetical protein GUITHDRAFT_48709, partial [Guillardia theta CCMP2712]
DGEWLKDSENRRVLLRGVNLGGSSKMPVGLRTNDASGLERKGITFVGRPFPLEEADEHLERLACWGLTFLRFLVTWEAVEHEGPGVYDREYLTYVRDVIRKAGQHGISVFVDPHQDVWSRWTGGDGAPAWTLDAAGFEVSRLHESGAAFTHQHHGDPLPSMMWIPNHMRLAAGTMFTLFFGGRDFAPLLTVEGKNIQDWLQEHYIRAMVALAETLRDEPNVLGFDTLNEPNLGMIGWEDVRRKSAYLKHGWCASWFESFQLGEGKALAVDYYYPSYVWNGKKTLNAGRVRAWREGRECVWKQHGVWDVDERGEAVLLKPHYFQEVRGRKVNAMGDYFVPFLRRFMTAIRKASPGSFIFIDRDTDFEDPTAEHCPRFSQRSEGGIIWAPHWYDVVPLVAKSFRSWVGLAHFEEKVNPYKPPIVLGKERVAQENAAKLKALKKIARGIRRRGCPTIIGEIGIPFNMNDGESFRTNDFNLQISAMDSSLRAVEEALVHATIWNYTPDNCNRYGDGWNGEDLSVYCADQVFCCYVFSGGRALPAVIRPYPMRTAGEPKELRFEVKSRRFVFSFCHDPESSAPTIIFLPYFQYP